MKVALFCLAATVILVTSQTINYDSQDDWGDYCNLPDSRDQSPVNVITPTDTQHLPVLVNLPDTASNVSAYNKRAESSLKIAFQDDITLNTSAIGFNITWPWSESCPDMVDPANRTTTLTVYLVPGTGTLDENSTCPTTDQINTAMGSFLQDQISLLQCLNNNTDDPECAAVEELTTCELVITPITSFKVTFIFDQQNELNNTNTMFYFSNAIKYIIDTGSFTLHILDQTIMSVNSYTADADASSSEVSFACEPVYGTLSQLHLHWGGNDSVGSEHQVDGEYFSAESHLVTTYIVGEVTRYVVIARLYTVGEQNEQIQQMIEDQDGTADLTTFDITSLYPDTISEMIVYNGSLTTPGCDEDVFWVVVPEPLEISSDQLAALRVLKLGDGGEAEQALTMNWRQLQDRNGRLFERYILEIKEEEVDGAEDEEVDDAEDDNSSVVAKVGILILAAYLPYLLL